MDSCYLCIKFIFVLYAKKKNITIYLFTCKCYIYSIYMPVENLASLVSNNIDHAMHVFHQFVPKRKLRERFINFV